MSGAPASRPATATQPPSTIVSAARQLRALRGAALGLAVASVLWIVVSFAVFIWRATYPLELEWLEGGMLVHALRIRQGAGIYVEPSREFVPFLYTPLYPWLLAQLGRVFGIDFWLGRTISIVSVAVICVLSARAVIRERWEHLELALFAAAAPLAAFVFTSRWLDLARADSLMLALYLGGLMALLVALRHDSIVRAVLAGAFVSLAFWTKQTAVVLILASGLAALPMTVHARAWRSLAAYVGSVAMLCLGGLMLGQRLTQGWLWFYVYQGHQGHELNWERLTRKAWWMHLHAAPFVALALALLLAHALRQALARKGPATGQRPSHAAAGADVTQVAARGNSPRAEHEGGALAPTWHECWFWCCVAIAGLVVGAIGYSTQWAESNAFIPGVTLSAIAIAVATTASELSLIRSFVTLLLAAQLAFSALLEPQSTVLQQKGPGALLSSYRLMELGRTAPSLVAWRAALAQREVLLAAAKAGEGPLFALHRPWWSVLVGDPGASVQGSDPFLGEVSAMGLNDVEATTRRKMQRDIQSDLTQERYARVFCDGPPPAWMLAVLKGHYFLEARLSGTARVRLWSGYMSDGGMSQPWDAAQLVLARVRDRELPAGARVIADFEENDFSGFELQGYSLGLTPAWSVHGEDGSAVLGSDGTQRRSSSIPLVGPIGGARLLSTANVDGLLGLGSALSPVIVIDKGEELVMLLGRGGRGSGVRVSIVDAETKTELVRVELPREQWKLEEVHVALDDAAVQRRVRVEVLDDDEKAAVFLDDLWVLPRAHE